MTAVQASSSLMVLGCSTLVIPAAYRTSQLDGSLDHSSNGSLVGLAEELGKQKGLDGLLKLSRGTAIVRGLARLARFHWTGGGTDRLSPTDPPHLLRLL